MTHKKYVAELTLDERNDLLAKISKGTLKAMANLKVRVAMRYE